MKRPFWQWRAVPPARVPTDRAFRLFIDALMEVQTLSENEHARIRSRFDELTPGANVMRETGKLLAEYEAGKKVVAQSGCLACHKIGENGNDGPGPHLTEIGNVLPASAIAQTLRNPTAPMPSFQALAEQQPEKFQALVSFLSQLK